MELSNAIREIRLLKGIKQKEVSFGWVSQGNYSKFENNTADIPSKAFISILKNLNIDLEEVFYIANGYCYSEEEELYREFFRFSITNIESLKLFIQKCEVYLENQQNQTITVLYEISLFLLQAFQSNNIFLNKEQVLHILEFFSNKEHLFIKDLYIINCIFFLFPIDVAHLTIGYIEKALKKYGDFQFINRIEVNLRMNYSLLLIKEHLEKQALEQLQKALSLAKSFKMSVLMGIIYVRMGICFNNLNLTQDINFIHKGKLILEVLDETDLLDRVNTEINNYLK